MAVIEHFVVIKRKAVRKHFIVVKRMAVIEHFVVDMSLCSWSSLINHLSAYRQACLPRAEATTNIKNGALSGGI